MTTNIFALGRDLSVSFIGEEIFHKRSPYQDILILDTVQFGRMLFLDNSPQLSEMDEFLYHETMVHPAMLAHENPADVLIIGGGDGCVLRETLKYPLLTVTLCDIDAEVVAASKQFLHFVNRGAFGDKRLSLEHEDGRKFLSDSDKTFDVIFLDITDPMGPSTGLFTKEFYSMVRSRLSGDGLMVFDADGPDYGGHFQSFVRTVEEVFPYVYPYLVFVPSLFIRQGFVICSNRDLSDMKNVNSVGERIKSAGLGCGFLSVEMTAGFFEGDDVLRYILSETNGPSHISTDSNPAYHSYR